MFRCFNFFNDKLDMLLNSYKNGFECMQLVSHKIKLSAHELDAISIYNRVLYRTMYSVCILPKDWDEI
jgi:hypothetical protein